jgi:tetratricopeptide (TPR) repeat protein
MRRLHFVLALILVAVAGTAVGVWKLNQTEAPQLSHREQAFQLVESCQWAAAVEACDALLAASPDDGEVYSWRGRANVALENYEAAIKDYSAAIAIRPADAEPLYCRGMVYERVGNVALADADYEAARQIDPRKDKLAEAIREEQAAADVRRVVREAARQADERADKHQAAKNSVTQQRTAALRESRQADQLAAEVAANEKANANATPGLKSGNAADATENNTTWAGVEVVSPFAEKPSLPQGNFSARGNWADANSSHLLSPGPFQRVDLYGEHPTVAAPTEDADNGTKIASTDSRQLSAEPNDANVPMDPRAEVPPAEQSLSGQSLWQQLQQPSVQRGLAATADDADSHTLFLGPRLTGPLASSGNASSGTSSPGLVAPGGFGAKPALPSSVPGSFATNEPATNEPAGRYPIRSWSAPQYGFQGTATQAPNGLSANSGTIAQQSGYAQDAGAIRASNRTLSNGATGGIALASGPVPGGPVLRPVAIERPSTSTTSSRRELAGQLSTASAPLAAPAVDRSSARAASRPGVLSTAIYELFQPTTPTGQPELSTHTAPLPTWAPAPSSSAASVNRATPSRPAATSGLPTPQLPPEDFGKANNAARRGRATLPELRLPDPEAATRALRPGRSR